MHTALQIPELLDTILDFATSGASPEEANCNVYGVD